MHKNAFGCKREEIVRQVKKKDKSVKDYVSYAPIGNAAKKLTKWKRQGATISYLSALTENKSARADELATKNDIKADKIVLTKYKFPAGWIYHRKRNSAALTTCRTRQKSWLRTQGNLLLYIMQAV